MLPINKGKIVANTILLLFISMIIYEIYQKQWTYGLIGQIIMLSTFPLSYFKKYKSADFVFYSGGFICLIWMFQKLG